jgi:hypothetical protein
MFLYAAIRFSEVRKELYVIDIWSSSDIGFVLSKKASTTFAGILLLIVEWGRFLL